MLSISLDGLRPACLAFWAIWCKVGLHCPTVMALKLQGSLLLLLANVHTGQLVVAHVKTTTALRSYPTHRKILMVLIWTSLTLLLTPTPQCSDHNRNEPNPDV